MKLVLGRQNPTFSVVAVQLRADITYSKATVSVIIDERGLNKYARDYINPVDLATIDVAKALSDNVNTTEAFTFFSTKLLAEDPTVTDDVLLATGFNRDYVDTFGYSDAITQKATIKWLLDSISAQDSIVSRGITAQYFDIQTLYDNADANSGDGLEYVDVKPATDSTLTSDQLASIDSSKALTDSASAASSGILRMTDYVDITYLAEDYVGSSRTIS